MAYAAIISLKQTLQQILIHPYIFLRPREKKHIESFHEKLEFLQRFLEEHPSHASNESVNLLERRIRDAAYEAEDSMDLHLNHLCNSEDMIWQMEILPVMMQLDSIVGEVTQIKEHMGLKIKRRRLSHEKEEIKTGEFDKHINFEPRTNNFRKDSSSAATKNLMVGFDDYLLNIKDQITGQSSALEVISIVGMGGIGKTTLATHVYNDPYVVHHFDIRAWVTVSQSYSIRDIMTRILDSMNKSCKGDLLGVDVYQNLKGRRYLIILDDIWDTSAWDDLKMMFPDDTIGSRIMLTSRIADVAEYASLSGTLHQISLLNNDHSWELLCAKVFGHDEPCPLNLQETGKKIAQNCGGLPLSIVVIGGLLSKLEKTQEVWQSVSENVTSFVFSSDDRCSALLRLSYNYLPQYLKACFLYLAVFPKNIHEISVSKLTRMWVAEGFLRQCDGQSPEEVAERSVEDLLDRSLILVDYKNYEGKIKNFKIHDLLFDFCVKEANDEKFVQIKCPTNLFPTSSASEHRISIFPVKEFENFRLYVDSMPSTVPNMWNLPPKEPLHRSPNLVERSQITVTEDWDVTSSMSYVRSFVSRGPGSFVFSNLFLGFKLLRVLDATEQHFSEFPPQILELLNLRYIALLCDGDIPASITKLWRLQILIIDRYSNPNTKFYLPLEIWIMSHLRHVRCRDTLLLDPSTATFERYRAPLVLEDLHTLSRLWNLKFTKEMLRRIPNIKKIDVVYDSRSLVGKELPDYQLENLINLHQLKALKISVIPYLSIENYDLFHPIFKVHFPPSLKILNLGGVRIPWHEMAIIGSLPNLEVLKLKDDACVGTEWATNEDEFCQLKVLALENLELEHWRAESDHFPRLQHLIVAWCDNLVEIPSGFGESMTLTTIKLEDCKDSVWDSANEIREKQLSDGNDGFQIIEE